MPEINLDEAFDTLTSEVGERTASRGAGAAISEARRRRTTVGAAAAVALIAVGGVVFSQLGDTDHAAPAVQVPPPAVLDAAALNSITEGWVSGWHDAGKDDEAALSKAENLFTCLDKSDSGTDTDPKRVGTQLMVGGSGEIAYLGYADFDGSGAEVDAASQQMSTSFATCAGNSGATDTYGDRASVTSYDLPVSGSETTETVWVGRLDNRLAFAMLLAPGEKTAAQRSGIGAALLSAVQVDETFKIADAMEVGSVEHSSAWGSASSDGGNPPVPAHKGLSSSDLQTALGGWATLATQGDSSDPKLACVKPEMDGGFAGTATTFAGGAEVSYTEFTSTAKAADGISAFLDRLASCSAGPWQVDSTTVPDVVVASHDGGTLWISQQGTTVALLEISGSTDPPADVATAVGRLLVGSVS